MFMKKIILAFLGMSLLASPLYAVTKKSEIVDIIKQGASTVSDKEYIYDIGAGSANPRFRANSATNELEVAHNGVSYTKINSATGFDSGAEISNLGVAGSVGASALTISIIGKNGSAPSGGNVVKLGFRNSTAATGTYVQRSITSSLSVVVSSGSTLGSVNAIPNYIYVYLIDNAGTVEIAVSATKFVDEGSLYSTTAEGGAGAADDRNTLYSTTARTNVAIRLVGRVKSTQATAGTWATAPSEISIMPFEQSGSQNSEVFVMYGNGNGSTDTGVRRWTTTVRNVGSAITYTDSATLGATFTINEDGLYYMSFSFRGPGGSDIAITKNSTQNATAVNGFTTPENFVLKTTSQGTGGATDNLSTMSRLQIGDVIRGHAFGADDVTNFHNSFTIVKVSN